MLGLRTFGFGLSYLKISDFIYELFALLSNRIPCLITNAKVLKDVIPTPYRCIPKSE